MEYCEKCGNTLKENDKFCPACGRKVEVSTPSSEGADTSTFTERKLEYAGRIVRCPACGEELPSFTAVCPSCGHEINSQKTSSSVKAFIDDINRLDSVIAEHPRVNYRGWKTWKKPIKIIWVILNILTSFIPLVIYLIIPLVRPLLFRNRVPALTTEENKKALLIENAIFPNEREAIIEALLFVKSKLAFLASTRFNDNTLYWTELWSTKAEQLWQRAQVILINDQLVSSTQAEIVASKAKIERKARIRAGIGAGIVGTYLIVVLCCGSIFNVISLVGSELNRPKAVISHTSDIEIPTISADAGTDEDAGIYSYSIRNYIGKNVAAIGKTSGVYQVDEYGSGELRLVFISNDGMVLSGQDESILQQYIVIGQNLTPGTNLTLVNQRDSKGNPYSNLISYQSYEEIILYVSKDRNSTVSKNVVVPLPTLDRHTYHIRDYTGRNAASFGKIYGEQLIDDYGAGKIRIMFTAEDGTYVDDADINSLRSYIVISQDIAPNTELKLYYEKDSKGKEYDSLVKSQNYDEINLTVQRIGAPVMSDVTESLADTNHLPEDNIGMQTEPTANPTESATTPTESTISPSEALGNMEDRVIEVNSIEVLMHSNKHLEIKDFGYHMDGEYMWAVVVLSNPSDENAIEFPSYRVTAYDEYGKILGTEEQVLSVIYPRQDFACASLLIKTGKKPSQIDVTAIEPDDYNISPVDLLEHQSHKQMYGKNLSVGSNYVTGEIVNPNNYSVASAMVTVIFRDNNNKIVYSAETFIDKIPANGSLPFEVYYYSNMEIPSKCEVFAYLW
ncbi:MAG: zinc ribbon domain-containing protein [Faecousia sp.]